MTDYYQILGLNQDATHEEIREAYRKLALKFHPDKNNGDKYFEEWSKKINEAYDTLGNPDKRKEYDRSQRGNYSNNQSNNNQQSHRDKEYQTLLYLRGRYGEYKKAKDNYKVALKNLNTVSNYSKPNHLSFIKISLGVIGILIGLIGLKNTYGTSNNDVSQQTEVSAITGDEETNESSSQNIDQDYYQENTEESEIDFLEVSQEISQDLVLTTNRAYFYDSPVDEIGNGKYLVRGDKIYATRQYNDFVYTEFQNNEGVITRGWVKKNLFEPYASPSMDDNEILIDTQIFEDNPAGNTDTNHKKKKGIFRKIFGKKNKD